MQKLNLLQFSKVALFALFASTFLFQSCEADTVKGCTDPDSLNYNELADEDDGNCLYNRDRFLGIYVGGFNCLTFPLFNNDSIAVEITEGTYATRDSVKVTFTGSNIPVLSLAGTIVENTMTVSGQINDFPYTVAGITTIADITTNGVVVLSQDEQNLDGNITIKAMSSESGSTLVDTDCEYNGVKQ